MKEIVNWFNLVNKVKELFVKVEDLEEQGVQGPKGDKGDPGEQGPKGDKGDDGALAGITLPTSDPGDGISIWNDGGVLKVSLEDPPA